MTFIFDLLHAERLPCSVCLLSLVLIAQAIFNVRNNYGQIDRLKYDTYDIHKIFSIALKCENLLMA